MPVTKEEILSLIRTYVTANNGTIPGEMAFAAATKIKSSSWRGRYWARWTDAVVEAGYEPNAWNQKIPDAEMLEQLAGFVAPLEKFPSNHEINIHARKTKGFPSWAAFKRRHGGMSQLAAALLELARANGDDQLAAICESRITAEESKSARLTRTQPLSNVPLGFVYLKYSPSLRLFKIGKADNPNKRGSGISLLLPHDLKATHEIRTDCPYVLEKYWHQRFKAKRKQGEWFDLTTADIESFKARREFLFREFFP